MVARLKLKGIDGRAPQGVELAVQNKLKQNKMTQERVCVTGANGYIGSLIALNCLKAGYLVNGTVRALTEDKMFLNSCAESLGLKENLTFFEIPNLDQEEGWDDALAGCDYLLHVASPVKMSAEDPENEIIKPAVNGTLNALNAALKAGVKHVVVTSSLAAMVGDQRETDPKYVFTEDDWNENPGSPYSKSKVEAEKAAWKFVEENPQITLTVVCPSYVLGPVLSPNSLSGVSYIVKIITGEPGPVFKVGYIDVRDVADVCIKAITDERAINQRYLVSCAPQITLYSVIKLINENFEEYNIELKDEGDLLEFGTNPAKTEEFLGRPLRQLPEITIDMVNSLKELNVIQ
eukprot:TRINITY_DN2222_c0_g1_i1.p1 TRINITY_DN2222_c0_g1~~TRINITY_DN2222_c0_g1_i1.p1  ORF type:complete len:348 (+),score=94.59 TRINITY_DN2222_c0_g1_i1:47-1090(+)